MGDQSSIDSSRAVSSAPVETTGGEMIDGQSITPSQLRAGYKCYIDKDGEKRLAEILMTRVRKGKIEFYVHFENYNKRLDEWAKEDRLDLSRPVQLPKIDKPKKPETPQTGKANKKSGSSAAARISKNTSRKATPAGGKENDASAAVSREDTESGDMMDLDAIEVNGNQTGGNNFDREGEIEKLRTSGSMTQNSHEVARVRNLSTVIMGAHEIEPWYFSPYPPELTEEDYIYICEFSLCYFGSKKQFERFRSKCTLKHPPGNEIYRDDDTGISFFEIDGRRQRTWCRNLCLFSKLFLDHKTLYYDVDPFLFYCMTKRDEKGHHFVGYFSKEKESAEAYNVACILTLPQYQRHGYGRVLIDFSYNLSKKEGKLGSPEKPLSDLGLLSYRSYWSETIVQILAESGKGETSIDDIAAATAMTTADILHTLQTLNMLKYYKGQHIICLTEAVLEKYESQKAKKRIRIDPDKLIWKPPVFTAAQLRFAW